MNVIVITMHAAFVVCCWVIVALGAAFAVYSRTVNDTTLERASLCALSVVSFANAWAVVKAGWVSEGGLLTALCFAVYVFAIFLKHWRGVPTPQPFDKSNHGKLQ